MKKLFITVLACASLSLIPASAQILVGSGSDSSYLVIEATAFGAPLIYEYLYTYNPADPFDTYAMVVAIDTATTDLSFDFSNFGTSEEPNYFLNSITYSGDLLANTGAPSFSPFWAQWVSGGESGFPSPVSVPSGAWSEGVGASYRYVEPGSWDGFVFNGAYNPDPPFNLTSPPPSVVPVPEPSAALLIFFAAGVWVWQKRRGVGVQRKSRESAVRKGEQQGEPGGRPARTPSKKWVEEPKRSADRLSVAKPEGWRSQQPSTLHVLVGSL